MRQAANMRMVSKPECERPALAPKPTYDARKLVGESGVADIILDGQEYTLRITKQSKLLLTK